MKSSKVYKVKVFSSESPVRVYESLYHDALINGHLYGKREAGETVLVYLGDLIISSAVYNSREKNYKYYGERDNDGI